jgi:hypothetical protein
MKLEISERYDSRQHTERSEQQINPIEKNVALNLNDVMKNKIKFMGFSADRFLGTI